MKLSRALRSLSEGLTEAKVVGHVALLNEAADLLDATTPRPWPPPDGVTRCLGWDRDNERWRVCIHEYGGWIFEDGLGLVRNWCPVWKPMPPAPEVGP
jgi:hypothetical protein